MRCLTCGMIRCRCAYSTPLRDVAEVDDTVPRKQSVDLGFRGPLEFKYTAMREVEVRCAERVIARITNFMGDPRVVCAPGMTVELVPTPCPGCDVVCEDCHP